MQEMSIRERTGRSNEEQDQELVTALLKDLDTGFREVFDVYGAYCRSIANNTLCNHIDNDVSGNYYPLTEDVLQEALLRAFHALRHRYPSERIRQLHVKAWLHTITYREAKRYAKIETPWWKLDPLETIELLEQQGSRFEQPRRDLVHDELQQELHRALQQLSSKQRAVIDLLFFQDPDIDPDETKLKRIAVKLGMPLNTVKSHKQRAIQRLRKQFFPKKMQKSK